MNNPATDLNNVGYLIAVADGGSFSEAARRLGVPPSLVSRKVARLERDIGARLFQRTTRSVSLTDAGAAFLAHARAAMASFALAHDVLEESSGAPRGRVRLSAPAGLAGSVWPVVSAFLGRFPDVSVELDFADRYVDLVSERFDLAIRSRPESRSEKLIGRRLIDSPRRLFASPAYIDRRGLPRSVKALAQHDCIVVGAQAERATWHVHVGQRIEHVAIVGRVAVNEARVAADCAADGFGIAFISAAVCAGHVAAGRLQWILQRAGGGDTGLWLVYPDRHLPAASRALAEILVAELPIRVVGVASENGLQSTLSLGHRS